jgi:hypothetical protein
MAAFALTTEDPNDKIREQILKYFYDRNTSATSRFGKKGSAAKISDVKRELKKQNWLYSKSGGIKPDLSD